jgi:hypothetical protein
LTPVLEVRLHGSAGAISIAIDRPDTVHSLAVVAHPHPLFGGTRDNKVVQTLARAFQAMGYETWRPDFRGVGASEGHFDHGHGETDDLEQVIKHALETFQSTQGQPPRALVLAGFSFGSAVIARVFHRLGNQQLPITSVRCLCVGTAVSRFDVPALPEDTVLVHGDEDDTVPLSDVLAWAKQHHLSVQVVAGADHFFHRRLTHLKRLVWRAWGRPELAAENLKQELQS